MFPCLIPGHCFLAVTACNAPVIVRRMQHEPCPIIQSPLSSPFSPQFLVSFTLFCTPLSLITTLSFVFSFREASNAPFPQLLCHQGPCLIISLPSKTSSQASICPSKDLSLEPIQTFNHSQTFPSLTETENFVFGGIYMLGIVL